MMPEMFQKKQEDATYVPFIKISFQNARKTGKYLPWQNFCLRKVRSRIRESEFESTLRLLRVKKCQNQDLSDCAT